MVEIKNLVKRYGDLLALDHLNLQVREGEVFGLLGPNGSGKTTAINCMLALLKYDRGTIRIFGEEMTPESYHIKQQIGIVLQNVAVFDELTVYENIDYFCGLYIKEKQRRRELVEEAVVFAGLEDYRKVRPRKLSGGLLRRLNIACGIAHKPRLIIMDEPTTYLDIGQQLRFGEMVRKLSEEGKTVLLVLHDILLALKLSDRIAALQEGKIAVWGRPEEILEAGVVERLYGVRVGRLETDRGIQYYYDMCQGCGAG